MVILPVAPANMKALAAGARTCTRSLTDTLFGGTYKGQLVLALGSR